MGRVRSRPALAGRGRDHSRHRCLVGSGRRRRRRRETADPARRALRALHRLRRGRCRTLRRPPAGRARHRRPRPASLEIDDAAGLDAHRRPGRAHDHRPRRQAASPRAAPPGRLRPRLLRLRRRRGAALGAERALPRSDPAGTGHPPGGRCAARSRHRQRHRSRRALRRVARRAPPRPHRGAERRHRER